MWRVPRASRAAASRWEQTESTSVRRGGALFTTQASALRPSRPQNVASNASSEGQSSTSADSIPQPLNQVTFACNGSFTDSSREGRQVNDLHVGVRTQRTCDPSDKGKGICRYGTRQARAGDGCCRIRAASSPANNFTKQEAIQGNDEEKRCALEVEVAKDGGVEREGGQVRAGAQGQGVHADGLQVDAQQVVALLQLPHTNEDPPWQSRWQPVHQLFENLCGPDAGPCRTQCCIRPRTSLICSQYQRVYKKSAHLEDLQRGAVEDEVCKARAVGQAQALDASTDQLRLLQPAAVVQAQTPALHPLWHQTNTHQPTTGCRSTHPQQGGALHQSAAECSR